MRALSGDDYQHLVALYSVEPWGPERDNLHHAMQLSQVANMNRTKGAPVVEPSRFILTRKPKSNDDTKKIAALRGAIKQSRKQANGG